MVIFHSYVSLPEGTVVISDLSIGDLLKVALQPYRKIIMNNKMLGYGKSFSRKRRSIRSMDGAYALHPRID